MLAGFFNGARLHDGFDLNGRTFGFITFENQSTFTYELGA